MFAQTNAPYANRIQLVLAPFTGPFVQDGPLGGFDPRRDLQVYVDGALQTIQTFSFDAVNNRYLLYLDNTFNLQGVVQVVHHVPSPSFCVSLGVINYNLVATVVGSAMFYELTSLNPSYPLTASWSIPVNPSPASSSPADDFVLAASQITDLVINGIASTDHLTFFTVFTGGGFNAIQSDDATVDISLNGPQLYSGPESSPMMLAGTFILTSGPGTPIPGFALLGTFSPTGP